MCAKITSRRSSKMAGRMEGALLGVCGLLVVLCAAGPQGARGEVLRDVTGSIIKFDKTFDIVDAEPGHGFSYPFGFFFQGGSDLDPVQTYTEMSMGWEGNRAQILACRDGKLIPVDVSQGLPQDALLRVTRHPKYPNNSDVYQIQMTEATKSFVELRFCDKEGIVCSKADEGTPMSFRLSSYVSLFHRPAYLAATAAA